MKPKRLGVRSRSGYAPSEADPQPLILIDAIALIVVVARQDAFAHEDYTRLRAITTPEIMSYLAEELSHNAVHGRRNEVTSTKLLDAEVSEAWREQTGDYATIAMRYEGIDFMRDRTTGAVLSGDAERPSQTTELWTFVRSGAWGEWKVVAIRRGPPC